MEEMKDSSAMVDYLEKLTNNMVDIQCPTKTVQSSPEDLPYFTEAKKLKEAIKYRKKIIDEIKKGKRNSGYKAIIKLGDQPGVSKQTEIVLPA